MRQFALITLALLLAAPLAAAPREEALERGRVVERVATRGDASHTYALYIPSSYTPERRWPILYCFDPVARGAVPVERYREAAERYGWIVVGSNVSRNGSMRASVEAAQKMWEDTHARFAIDERRVYTTGFSGGARVATFVAYGCETCIAGVIGCGAGFSSPYNPLEGKLPLPIRFAYFATIGTDDFNFPELVRLDEALDGLDVTHHVRRFDGGHDWAPSALCVTAVEWMELEAMRAGTRPKESALVDAIYAKWLDEARALEAAGRPADALDVYEQAVARFEGLRDTAAAAKQAAALGGAKAIKEQAKADAEQIKRQLSIAGEIAGLASARKDQEKRLFAITEFRRRIEDLKSRSNAAEDTADRRVARRALHQIFAWFYEGGKGLAAEGKTAEAIDSLELAAEIYPRWIDVHYSLACARAQNGDRKKALEALEAAVEQGFKDAARLRAEPALAPLRGEPGFTRLVDSLDTNKDEQDTQDE